MYIFLDESGQFTKNDHEKYFVIGSFTVGGPRRTAKAFRGWYRDRFPKKMRRQSEIKWSATGISDALRLRTLKFISKLDVRIRYIYLLRHNIPSEFRKKDKVKDGLLYTNIVGETLEMYLPSVDSDFRVFCDKRKLSGMTAAEFKRAIRARMLPNLPKGVVFQIETVDSTNDVNVQIADWRAGALARYLESGKLGKECYAILKDNILGEGREIFGTESIHD